MVFRFRNPEKMAMVDADRALPGRDTEMPVPPTHFVLGHELRGPYPEGLETAMFALGCFWGAERDVLAARRRVHDRGRLRRGLHAEPDLRGGLQRAHRPHRGGARGVRPEGDLATTTCSACSGRATTRRRACGRATTSGRSTAPAIYTYSDAQREAAEASRAMFQARLTAAGYGEITTEILPAPEFYFAEDYHQQYLAKNPGGYCGLGGTGVSCPIGVAGV